MSKPNVLLVDGNNQLHRAYNAVVERRNPQFMEKNIATLFLSFIAQDLERFNCTHCLVAFDSKRSFRYDIYAGYKANRHEVEVDPGARVQTPDHESGTVSVSGVFVKLLKTVVRAAGIYGVHKKGLEADDVLASGARHLDAKKIILDSRDKDMLSCLSYSDRIRAWWPIEKRLIDRNEVMKHYGVWPEQMIDYLSLVGDSVDCIPGAPGIGPKTAKKWLAEFGSLGKALKNKKVKDKLKPHKNTLLRARRLITLRDDKLDFDIDDLELQPPDLEKLKTLVWKVPHTIISSDISRAKNMKGLFG